VVVLSIFSLPFPLLRKGVASPPGLVKAARSAPRGSLDGWRRCETTELEGMAAFLAGFCSFYQPDLEPLRAPLPFALDLSVFALGAV
jgi:hypothetical protein